MQIHSKCFMRRAAELIFLVELTAFSAPSLRANIPTLFGEVHGRATAVNSAVIVTAFTLNYFRKPVVMAKLATSLDAGTTWARSVKIARIKGVLEKCGLKVSVNKNVTFTKVVAWLSRHPRMGLAIINLTGLHLVGGHSRHYLVLLKSGPRGLYLTDLGAYTGWLSINYLKTHMGPDLDRFCLFVRPGGAPLSEHIFRLTNGRNIELNIGEIAAGPGILKIPFLLRNTLKKPIGISSARGTCFCFKQATIATADHEIAPGSVGQIVLSFDRGEIGIGNIEREVLLQFTNDPNHWFTVIVQGHITASHQQIQLTWYPQTIDLGQVRNRSALGGQEFTVLTPKGISLQSPTVSSKSIRVIRLNDSAGQSQVDDFGRTAHEFVVDLSNIPAGAVDQKITIGTTDKYIPKIVIPITGQIEQASPPTHGATP